MNTKEKSDSMYVKEGKSPVWVGVIVVTTLFILLGSLVFVLYKGMGDRVAAMANIQVADRAFVYLDKTVVVQNEHGIVNSSGLTLPYGYTCVLKFGTELEVVGRDQSKLLARLLSQGMPIGDWHCPVGTLFLTDDEWFLDARNGSQRISQEMQRIRTEQERERKIARELLAAEELIRR